MAVDPTGWQKLAGGPGGQGILQWGGQGPAPMLDPGTQNQFRSMLPFGNNMSFGAAPSEGFDLASLLGESAGGGGSAFGDIVNPAPGPMQEMLNKIFAGSSGNAAGTLSSLSSGQLPEALRKQIVGSVNESMGATGNRFGTDIAGATTTALGQAGASQSLAALQQILGLGGTNAGLEFQGQQSALDRSLQEYIANQANNPSLMLIQALLGGGLGI